MTEQADLDQDEYQRKLEAGEARAERVRLIALHDVLNDVHGHDLLTETMPAHKSLYDFFLQSVANEMKGEFVDYDTIGRNAVKTAAKFALEVADADERIMVTMKNLINRG